MRKRFRKRLAGPLSRAVRVAAIAALLVLSLAPPMQAAPQATTNHRAAVITLEGDIEDILGESVRDRVEEAINEGADVVIFKVDTWGGYVKTALEMNEYIQNLPTNVRTVAWVRPKAISAGALISVGCNEIWMSRSSKIGDSAPILMNDMNVGETERAKMESPIISLFRESARRHGYPALLCEAMVRLKTEVWWLERVDAPEGETPERCFADAAEKKKLLGEEEGEKGALSQFLPHKKVDVKWRLVKEVADPLGGVFEVRQPIVASDELLTMTQSEAVAYGFARGVAGDLDELAHQLGVQSVETKDISLWTAFVIWLNSPIVRGVLFMVMAVGAYMEFQSPGLIAPGAVAAVAALLFFGAPYANGLQYYWPLVAVIIGFVLLAVEVFFIPGFGVAGILGIALILFGLLGTFIPANVTPDSPWTPEWSAFSGAWDAIQTGIVVLACSVIASVIGLVVLSIYLPDLPGVSRLVGAANPEKVNLEQYDPYPDIAQVGDVGMAVGHLKPSGPARFGNDVVDVTTQGLYVEPGVKVQVIKRNRKEIVVRPIQEQA